MTTLAATVERVSLLEVDLNGISAPDRALIGNLWCQRAASELTSSVVFANITCAVLEQGAASEVGFLAAKAVSDEVRHAEICRRVACRYLNYELAFPKPRAIQRPAPKPSEARLVSTLHVVLNCCLNESVAMVFLRTCLDQAENELIRLALRELMREEIDHSRIGWAHLASAEVSDTDRESVARALPSLIERTRSVWLADSAEDVPSGHGCLPKSGIERVLDDALNNLILPGFERSGVPWKP